RERPRRNDDGRVLAGQSAGIAIVRRSENRVGGVILDRNQNEIVGRSAGKWVPLQGKILAGVDGLGRDEITQPGHAGIGASQTELREENVQIHGGNLDRIGAVAETAVERGLRRESSNVKQ